MPAMNTQGEYKQQIQKIIQLHNDSRTVAMNQKYYGSRVIMMRRFQLLSDIIIAASSTSSAISGWLLWSSPTGKMIWGAITAVATILALAKPFLKINKEIERYSKLFAEYAVLSAKMSGLMNSIRGDGYLSKLKEQSAARLLQKVEPLSRLEDPKPSPRLMEKCQDEVIAQFPTTSLWLPSFKEFLSAIEISRTIENTGKRRKSTTPSTEQ